MDNRAQGEKIRKGTKPKKNAKGSKETKVNKSYYFPFDPLLHLNALFQLPYLFCKLQKADKGRKRTKGNLRQKKEIPSFLMRLLLVIRRQCVLIV
jgi:hypothetical protein